MSRIPLQQCLAALKHFKETAVGDSTRHGFVFINNRAIDFNEQVCVDCEKCQEIMLEIDLMSTPQE